MSDNKFQKKVIKLISAIKRCNNDDLMLFVALVLIKFDLVNKGLFEKSVELKTDLEKDINIKSLLK